MGIPALDVRTNARQVILELQAFGDKVRDAAQVRGLNRTATTVRLEAQKLLQRDAGLPAMTVRKQIRLRRATKQTLKATLTFSNNRFRLPRFGSRQTPGGVRLSRQPKFLIAQPTWGAKPYEVPFSVLAQSFLAASKRNNPARAQNVWQREGRERYPLLLLLAPSLSDVFITSAIDRAMVAVAQRRYAEVLRQELSFIQLKRKP